MNVVQSGESKPKLYKVEVKFEVTNVYVTPSYTCAELSGFPDDLWWYSGQLKRSVHAIIKVGASYYLLDGDLATKAVSLARRGQPIDKLLTEDCKFIDSPLTKSKIYGKLPTADQTGPMFAWQVTDVDSLSTAQGGGKQSRVNQGGGKRYTIIRRYNTDHTIYQLVSGKGIVSAELSHHGTTCDINLKLKSFHR